MSHADTNTTPIPTSSDDVEIACTVESADEELETTAEDGNEEKQQQTDEERASELKVLLAQTEARLKIVDHQLRESDPATVSCELNISPACLKESEIGGKSHRNARMKRVHPRCFQDGKAKVACYHCVIEANEHLRSQKKKPLTAMPLRNFLEGQRKRLEDKIGGIQTRVGFIEENIIPSKARLASAMDSLFVLEDAPEKEDSVDASDGAEHGDGAAATSSLGDLTGLGALADGESEEQVAATA